MSEVVRDRERLRLADVLDDAELVVDGALGACECVFQRAVHVVPVEAPRPAVVTGTVRKREKLPPGVWYLDDFAEGVAVVGHVAGGLAATDSPGKASGVGRRCGGGFGLWVEVRTHTAAETLVAGRLRPEPSDCGVDDRVAADAAEFDGNPAAVGVERVLVRAFEHRFTGLPHDHGQVVLRKVGGVDRCGVDVHVPERRLDGGDGGTGPDETN